MDFGSLSDRGQIRPHNEDAAFVKALADDQILLVVADGMGGHKAGDIASQAVVDIFKQKSEQKEPFETVEEAEAWLIEVITEVNGEIFKEALADPEKAGMGTTVVAACGFPKDIAVAHVGDSRAYLLEANKMFTLLTEDHSLVNEYVKQGQITSEEAEHHPQKNVLLQALGTEEEVTVSSNLYNQESGYSLFLCSDGVTDTLSEETLGEMLRLNQQAQELVAKVIEEANAHGATDNVTAALLQTTDGNVSGR
ncbi:Stp1/IreP family PP2C-type Ser/Thr phosphatase [Salsuginibacillus kocurii]|uniref:Stp1/IreP family PP2C-type Ser/Thr phosphatase n=1 Tax=Salsuginibacillus kocurii TaxID=427078 RepID=UPI0003A33056|nr:Stp1/IreP family PP2C-type Ser/Thr phosphatase [Salsuginibacillus kocurii]